MSQSSWTLADAEGMHAKAPRSFFIPPAAERQQLTAGRTVRLVFTFPPREVDGSLCNDERMWVDIVETRPGNRYLGHLASTPVALIELHVGDPVEFGPEHIAEIAYTREELGYDADEVASLDARIVHQDQAPEFVTRRHHPSAGTDRWFLSLEQGRPEQVDTLPLGHLTDLWPGLAQVFAAGDGDWERVRGRHEWRRVGEPAAGGAKASLGRLLDRARRKRTQ